MIDLIISTPTYEIAGISVSNKFTSYISVYSTATIFFIISLLWIWNIPNKNFYLYNHFIMVVQTLQSFYVTKVQRKLYWAKSKIIPIRRDCSQEETGKCSQKSKYLNKDMFLSLSDSWNQISLKLCSCVFILRFNFSFFLRKIAIYFNSTVIFITFLYFVYACLFKIKVLKFNFLKFYCWLQIPKCCILSLIFFFF